LPAQEPIRFARTPDISPDGRLVAFSYLGDIWVVETIGGIARPVTLHEAHDFAPLFSPDGRQIAFSSNRNGNYDVFVVPVEGGKPKRLTFDSATDLANCWSPDGRNVLFASSRGISYPPSFDLYVVPSEGGRVKRVGVGEGKEGVYSPQGDRLAYVRGPGTWYRKGYRGSSNDDIWISDADGTHNRRLTSFVGQDTSPMWSADGKFVYYVSEYFGNPANVVRQSADGQTPPQQVTFHKEDAVRRARISHNGEWIVYECGPDIWVVSTDGGTPRKLAIEVHADDKVNTERVASFTRGASEFALSPDEKQVAFVVHGEVFVMPATGGKAKRLTEIAAFHHGLAWSPDGKKLVFASDRGGHEDLYLLQSAEGEPTDLCRAQKYRTIQLTNDPEAEIGPSFSPDGNKVSFLRAGRLWTVNPDGTDARILADDVDIFDYDWSPDSKWVVYARQDGSFASELYVIPSKPQAKAKPRNITRYATYNGDVSWSGDGRKIAFISQRRHQPSMFVLSLEKPAAAGVAEGKSVDIEWDDIHLRVKQPANMSVEEGAISADGQKVAFRSSGGAEDLWVADCDGGHLVRITTGGTRPQQIQWSRITSDRIYFRDAEGYLRTARASVPGESSIIHFKAKMTVRRDEEFAEMFQQSWRALRENFYDPQYHGADWEAIRAKYLPLVHHVALKEDLFALISLMLGELNSSHLGITGFVASPPERTAELGLLFEERLAGPALRIVEIVKRGPADKRGIDLRPGDLIRSIDGVELTERTNIAELLNDKIGETVALEVCSAKDPKSSKPWRRVEIQAVSREQMMGLMYERWVEGNTRLVAKLSHNRLGYIHIPNMDDEGLETFLRSLYSDNFDKDAIVLDVRYNGGGFTHDQILNYLGGKEHTFFRQRCGSAGSVMRPLDRKWTKPLVLLINNRSFSDAEIFPSAFRTLGLGKLVGQPTGGHVIGTSTVHLIDGSLFQVPRTGVYTVQGVNMERQGVVPDVLVDVNPDDLAEGRDAQLEKAVDVLTGTVAQWKKTHQGVALQNTGASAAMPIAGAPSGPDSK
jgi:tricorn protease